VERITCTKKASILESREHEAQKNGTSDAGAHGNMAYNTNAVKVVDHAFLSKNFTATKLQDKSRN